MHGPLPPSLTPPLTFSVPSRDGSPLLSRARDFLARGPATAQELIAAVCQMPAVPLPIAEDMSVALLSADPSIGRDASGLWTLFALPPATDVRLTRLDAVSFAVVDVETTGGRPLHGDRIIEFAAAIVRDGTIADVFETLVNPGRPIPPWIARLTKISTDMVTTAPFFDAVSHRVADLLSGHVFVAHNVRFDWGFVNTELVRAAGRTIGGHRLCTVRLARALLPAIRRRSLDSLANYYGLTIARRHRAGDDAVATAKVLIRLLGIAVDRGCETLADLERLLGETNRRRGRRRRRAMPQPALWDTTA